MTKNWAPDARRAVDPRRRAHRPVRGRSRPSADPRLPSQNGLSYMALLAAHIAHELNTPLASISLLVATTRRLTDDPKVLEKLDRIDKVRRQCAAIIADVMALGRFQKPVVQEADLCTLAHAAFLQAEPYRLPGVIGELRVGRGPVLAEVDPIQIQLVLTDLLKNAYQATARGAVTIAIREHARQVRIAVVDTGSGMSPEVRERIFTPFFTTKDPGQGTGLGLVFCKNVVSSHGGQIRVGTKPGHGSTFTIVLPKKASHANPHRRR